MYSTISNSVVEKDSVLQFLWSLGENLAANGKLRSTVSDLNTVGQELTTLQLIFI